MDITDFIHIDPLPGYGTVNCNRHLHSLHVHGVLRHFNEKHNDHTSPKQRRQLQAYVEQFISDLHVDISQVKIPTEPVPIIPYLSVHRGLKCTATPDCHHIITGEKVERNIKDHLREAHSISFKTRPTDKRRTWWSAQCREVLCQQFFPRVSHKDESSAAQFFEVVETSSSARPIVIESSPNEGDPSDSESDTTLRDGGQDTNLDVTYDIEAEFEEAERQIQEEEAMNKSIVPLAGVRQTSPFLEHTQFQKCIEGLSWDVVHSYTYPQITPILQYLRDTVKSTSLVYQYATACTPRWARIIAMQENSKHAPLVPLAPYMAFDNHHSNTMVSIFTVFYQIFTRAVPPPPTLKMNKRQGRAFKKIQAHLEEVSAKIPTVDTKHTRYFMTPAEKLCHHFWMSLVEQTGTVSDFELALVTPLAFLAVDVHKDEFRAAYNFATDCSAIKKFMRMAGCYQSYSSMETTLSDSRVDLDIFDEPATMEEEAEKILTQLPVAPKDDKPMTAAQIRALDQDSDQDSDEDSDEDATSSDHTKEYQDLEEKAAAQNDQFREWVQRYLTDDYHTAMSWVISTSRYIAKERYSDTVDAFVRWQGSQVTIRHVVTSVEAYTAMVWALVDDAQSRLQQLAFADNLTDLPAIPWDSLRCDPSNQTPGYTPFSPESPALQGGKNYVRSKMIECLKSKTSKPLLIPRLGDFEKVQRYCRRVQEFLDILFLLVHLTSGQPGRLTEVLSVQVANTLNNGPRNLFLFNDLMAVVPRYHKGYNYDKSLKVVYRFLPRQIGNLLAWYLWLIRPFYTQITAMQREGDRTPHYFQARSPFLWSNKKGEQYLNAQRFGNMMRKYTSIHLGVEIGPGIMRHLIIAIGRYIDRRRVGEIQVLTPEEADDFQNEQEAEFREMQAGHRPNTGIGIYAQMVHRVFRAASGDAQAFCSESEKMHRELGFTAVPRRKDEASRRPEPRFPLPNGKIDLLSVLRANLRHDSRFRGNQKQVIDSILAGDPAVSYIAGTGSGKSLAFLLPALCDGYGITIVITPLIALRSDLIERCKQLGIRWSVCGEPGFDETAQILFVMPEQLAQQSFTTLVNRLRGLSRLSRIVVDEFHYVLLPDHEYRKALLDIRDVAIHGTPLTLLSATIPARLEPKAYAFFGVNDHIKAFRESTVRKNTRYEVVELDTKGRAVEEKQLVEYIRKEHARRSKKTVVYVATTKLADKLSKALGCSRYHSKMPKDERERVLLEFAAAEGGILVATTSMNAGVDISDIDLVIRLGLPDHMITWCQEGGRAGRDGRICYVVIALAPDIPTHFGKLDPEEKRPIEQLVERGKAGTDCMRVIIDAYFDGDTKRQTCRPDEQPCVACARLHDTSHPPIAVVPPATRSHGPTENRQTSRSRDDSDEIESSDSRVPETPVRATPRRETSSRPPRGLMGAPPTTTPVQRFQRLELSSDNPNRTRSIESETPPPPYQPTSTPRAGLNHHMRTPNAQIQRTTPTRTSSPLGLKRDTPATPTSPVREAVRERANRVLAFNQANIQARNREGARIQQEELKATAEWWSSHCAKCWMDGVTFDDHSRVTCTEYMNATVDDYRMNKMQGKFGSGTCYWCALPTDSRLCRKWFDEETGAILTRVRRDVDCTYNKSIFDTWVCVWEAKGELRQKWIDRIKVESDGQIDASTDEGFFAHFSKPVRIGGRTVSRVAYDVNILTHELFINK
jgi:superfamily II DNA helicase RecQ